MEHLDERGILENTLIFFLSDNGGAGMHTNQSRNDPLKGWKGNKFEGGHRVPFFITWKGRLPAGQRFEGLSSALDILPTTLAAAGIERPAGEALDGVNLLPFLEGRQNGNPHPSLFWRKDAMAAMRMGHYKLIRLEGYGYRLYDLASDLGESKDLSSQKPELFNRMAKELIRWEKELVAPYWYEPGDWNKVTYEIHRGLMENREPRYRNPSQMKRWEEAEKQKKSEP
jgi:arylsulfatase A-like enzyme